MPTDAPAIGDTCAVGTWRVLRATLVIPFNTPRGVVSVSITGGAGELDHYFSNGTVVEDLAGTALAGTAHGYRVVLRTGGTLTSPVVFLNGRETVEPIDASGDHSTFSVNGGRYQPFPQASYESLGYTCAGNTLIENDGVGDVFTYQRVSSNP